MSVGHTKLECCREIDKQLDRDQAKFKAQSNLNKHLCRKQQPFFLGFGTGWLFDFTFPHFPNQRWFSLHLRHLCYEKLVSVSRRLLEISFTKSMTYQYFMQSPLLQKKNWFLSSHDFLAKIVCQWIATRNHCSCVNLISFHSWKRTSRWRRRYVLIFLCCFISLWELRCVLTLTCVLWSSKFLKSFRFFLWAKVALVKQAWGRLFSQITLQETQEDLERQVSLSFH